MDRTKDKEDSKQWTANFVPREAVEKSRNCKGVDKEVREMIVRRVFDCVLNCKECEVKQLEGGRTWRKGGRYW